MLEKLRELYKGVRYLIYKDGEKAYYDDSDFYYCAIDLEECDIKVHQYGSTRYAGDYPLENSIMMYNSLQPQPKENIDLVNSLALKISELKAQKYIEDNKDNFVPREGDIVEITNKRAKNFGLVFEVAYEYDKKYGYHNLGCHLVSKEGVETKYTNVTIVEHSQEKIKSIANSILNNYEKSYFTEYRR